MKKHFFLMFSSLLPNAIPAVNTCLREAIKLLKYVIMQYASLQSLLPVLPAQNEFKILAVSFAFSFFMEVDCNKSAS